MSARHFLTITGDAAGRLLKFTHESSGVLPLKSVAGDALQIVDLVKKFRTSKKDWQEFGTYVQDIVATIADSLGIVDTDQTEIIEKLEKLRGVLSEITETIKSKQRGGFWARSRHFLEYPDMIIELKKKIDDAIDRLKFDSTVKTEIKVDKTLKIAGDNSQKLSKAALDATRSKLRYVDGASWDPDRVCLEHTRKHVIDEIISWVDNATDSRAENILLLTGVAGAGKSTVAHTIAQHYHSKKQLVTSFFFDRETNERNNPRHLISTISTDLFQTNEQLAKHIMRIIEEDERVASAPISRQFEELVLNPCRNFDAPHPLLIVLDALDEGYDDHLSTILSQRVSQLPHRICFVVTSRSLPELEDLRQQSHVHEMELDIHTSQNRDDIAVFVSDRLNKVAKRHRLGDHWPDPKLVASFTTRAEGLFLWVATVCDYLLTRSDPASELQELVSAPNTSSTSAESKMDALYATILHGCNWDDRRFVDDYHRLMGAAVASKTPLTLDALGKLYQREQVISNLVRRQLSPLLTGLGDDKEGGQAARFLHQSFRDFLTLRASDPNASPENRKFAIHEKAHSQTLAFLCLCQMNRELSSNTPGVGYLAQNDSTVPGIPSAGDGNISEPLWYACRFWVDHLLDIELPLSPPMLEQLREFLSSRLTLWMELIAVYGQHEGLSRLQNWAKEHPVEQNPLISLVCNKSLGSASRSLTKHLDYMGRLEEALLAAREGVEIYRKLAEDASLESRADLSRALHALSFQWDKLGYQENALTASEEALTLRRQLADEQPTEYTPDLASALHSFSVDLDKLGRHEEALEAIEESVKLRRQLEIDRPTASTRDLARSVHQLSMCLFNFGRYEEALQATEEEVKIQRQLASEQPAVFTSELAGSLHSLSVDLDNLGRREEALEAIETTVKLRRQLASERPAVFTSDLAYSVHALSIYLYNLGRHKEALEATEESVKLRRQLASERPAAFTSDLAKSVHSLSICLYSLGRHEEALSASEEAVKLRRQLVSERPAAFTPDLASSLNSLAIDYKTSGFHQKALATIKESVELYRPFAERYPAKHGPQYSTVLQRLEEYSSQAEAHSGALDSPQPDAATPAK